MALEDCAVYEATTAMESPGPDSSLPIVAPGVAHLLRERDEARARAEALASSIRRLEAFLGIASHELRAPVMSSSLAVQVAAGRVDRLRQYVAEPG